MKRDRHGDRAGLVFGLHHDVTSALANPLEAVGGEDLAYLVSREDPQSTQPQPRVG